MIWIKKEMVSEFTPMEVRVFNALKKSPQTSEDLLSVLSNGDRYTDINALHKIIFSIREKMDKYGLCIAFRRNKYLIARPVYIRDE